MWYSIDMQSTKSKIRMFVKKWVKLLQLGSWTIDVVFETYCEENPMCLAETVSDWKYLVARITFYTTAIDDRRMSDYDLEFYVVHEMVHIALCATQAWHKEQGEYAMGVMERETQLLAQSLMSISHKHVAK